jgi:hypothetical protein
MHYIKPEDDFLYDLSVSDIDAQNNNNVAVL